MNLLGVIFLLAPLIVVGWFQVIRQVKDLLWGEKKCKECGTDGWNLIRQDETALYVQCIKCGWISHLQQEEPEEFV